jgi:hypothetical protein
VVCRKVDKRGFLADLYATASQSIGFAAAEDSEAIQTFPHDAVESALTIMVLTYR